MTIKIKNVTVIKLLKIFLNNNILCRNCLIRYPRVLIVTEDRHSLSRNFIQQ